MTFNAINFGSGWHPFLDKLPGRSGSITMMTRLRDHFVAHGPLSAAHLASISAADCADLFQQPLEPPVDRLMTLFAEALNELGHLLIARYDGHFDHLVDAADHSAERLVVLLLDMAMFRDVARYHDFDVPLLKRAQLTAADIANALGGKGRGAFHDLDQLTIFADNLVPHVLRLEGALTFAPELVDQIEAGQLLETGSPQETEMRAVAVHAVELIVEQARNRGQPIRAMDVDYRLWTSGQQPHFKAVPRPRAQSIYY